MRILGFGLWALGFGVLLMASGCVTHRDKVAVVRAVNHLGSSGNATDQAIAGELTQVAVDIGALDQDASGAVTPGDVDPAAPECAPTAELASRNAAGIAAERKTRRAAVTFLGELGKGVLERLPWGTSALALLGAGWALVRKRAVQSALTGVVQAGMEIREKAKAGEPLGEAAVKGILSFWSSASGAKAEVEAAVEKVKPLWQPKAPDAKA